MTNVTREMCNLCPREFLLPLHRNIHSVLPLTGVDQREDRCPVVSSPAVAGLNHRLGLLHSSGMLET